MHTVQLAQVAPQPWKNGGGSTQELLAWPAAEAWQLRISVARIDRNGPFSAYPGVLRWFVVLDGAGVVLHRPGGDQRVVPGDAPLRFDGAEAPGCALIDGPTLDLNLMLRGDAGRGSMTAAHGDAPLSPWRALFSHSATTLDAGGERMHVAPGTLVWSGDATAPWRIHGAVPRAWWITFEPGTT